MQLSDNYSINSSYLIVGYSNSPKNIIKQLIMMGFTKGTVVKIRKISPSRSDCLVAIRDEPLVINRNAMRALQVRAIS